MTPVIQSDEPLPDSIFNATSSMGPNYVPSMARLTNNPDDKSGAWSPMINDQTQYLQITLPQQEPLYGVIMAGNPEFDNYVTLYEVCIQESECRYRCKCRFQVQYTASVLI